MNLKFGLELTFLPKKPTKIGQAIYHEWINEDDSIRVAENFNKELVKYDNIFRRFGMLFFAKSDVFRRAEEDQPHKAYCCEVNCHSHWCLNSDWLIYEFKDKKSKCYKKQYINAIKIVFNISEKLNLVARISYKKDDKILEFCNGASHLHIGADWFDCGKDYFRKMALAEKTLCIDYHNNCYLRWLFCQFTDDINSYCPYNLHELGGRLPNANEIWDKALMCNSIEQRFSGRGNKNRYLSYEFRFFNAVANVGELTLDIKFLYHWINYIIGLVNQTDPTYQDKGYKRKLALNKLKQLSTPTLTANKYKRLSNLTYARKQMQIFFNRIGLDFQDYEAKFTENYARRVKWGKMV